MDVTQYQFNPVRDVRHEDYYIESYEDDYKQLIDLVLESDTVIFASPVYWYSISASLKAFIDHWSETMKTRIIMISNLRWLKRIFD